MNTNDTQRILEELVDSTSVSDVLETLTTICHDKAEHHRASWQDERMAITWERAGNKLLGFRAKFQTHFGDL